jgi:menaquinol-cytochrome c reductase iron-sulfur subunit
MSERDLKRERQDGDGAADTATTEVGTPGRRKVMLAVLAGTSALAAGVGIPTAVFVAAPLSVGAGHGRWVRTVRFDQLKDGEPTRVAIVDDRRDAWSVERAVDLGSAWLVRKGDVVHAFSAVCPHLGCSVNAVADGGGSFACPCHTSAFAPDGQRTSGPAPRNLDALATRVEDGVVVVEFKRFRIGIHEQVVT